MNEKVFYEVNDAQPRVLEHFVGQAKNVVERVKICLEASWNDGVRFPHSLMVGAAGLGKTQISNIIAAEMGVELKEQLAQNLTTPADMRGFLLEAGDRDILLIDEIHELPPSVQTTLYRALENGKVFLNGSKTKNTKTIQLSNLTLLGATTDPHLLLKPLRDRFKITLPFDFYSTDELEIILLNRCKQLGWDVFENVIPLVAKRGRGTPRIALSLLESVRRTAISQNSPVITLNHFQRTCDLEGLDAYGLTKDDRTYLSIVGESEKPLRLNIIASRLGMKPTTVTEMIEKYLIRIDLICKDDKGRFLTDKGRMHLKRLSS